MRNFVINNSRSYNQIINVDSSQPFFIGYKIEKISRQRRNTTNSNLLYQ